MKAKKKKWSAARIFWVTGFFLLSVSGAMFMLKWPE